jgi:hypothetical protein
MIALSVVEGLFVVIVFARDVVDTKRMGRAFKPSPSWGV